MSNSYINSIFSGVGGQGVLTVGELIAYAAIHSGLNATSLPEYGTEVRGGSASCTVVLSSEQIGSPIIKHPQSILALSQSAVDSFLPRVAKNGFALINSSLAQYEDSEDVTVYPVPVSDLAKEAGLEKMLNMVALGAFVQISKIVELDVVFKALDSVIPKRYMHLKDKNIEALNIGYDYAAGNFS